MVSHPLPVLSYALAVKVRHAIILAAGYGTRFLPATKTVPKEMLPIVDRPVIHYIVDEALAAGLEHIIIVTSSVKRSVEDYFDHEFELEASLRERGKTEILRVVEETSRLANITFVRQKERQGIAHAVLMARAVCREEPFALFFPDDVIFSETPVMSQLLDVHARHGGSVIAVNRMPPEEVVHYGVITPEPVEPGITRVRAIVEKPRSEDAPSDLATVGRYVLMPEIWPLLERTEPGVGGEIQLTDTLAMLIDAGHPLYSCEYQGERFDTGRPIGLIKANVRVGLQREDIASELSSYLRGLELT
jgi:UTP--glucose-1-phosphate uridylyltransferase